jgi:hypothetical protein
MAMLVFMPAAAQDIRGDWHGALEVEGDAPLRLALHIASGNSAEFKATLVSIDEDGTTLAVDSVYANGSIIRFEMKDVCGTYEGRITAGGSIAGSWRQNGGTWPLTWERGGDPADIVEPFDGEKAVQEGRLYAQCFYDGKFTDLWAKLSPVMQQALVRADKLRDLRVQVENQFGSETNIIEETVKPDGALQVYHRLAKFDVFPGRVELQIAFNPRGMVSRFAIRRID